MSPPYLKTKCVLLAGIVRRYIKSIKMEEQKIKVFLFVDDMIVYTENLKESVEKL